LFVAPAGGFASCVDASPGHRSAHVCVALFVVLWASFRTAGNQLHGPFVCIDMRVLNRCAVARQEADGGISAYFSSWLRTRAQAQEVRSGQRRKLAVGDFE